MSEETALAVIDPEEMEESAREAVETLRYTAPSIVADPYVGVAALPFDEKAQRVLAAAETVPDEWIDIKPNGQIYLSHINARKILNQAFGYGGWAIVPVGDFRPEESGNKVTLYRTYRMYVNGRYVGEVESAGEYWKSNPEQNYGDAAEAAQSYALNRLSKNFGIASQCWDKAYIERFKAEHAETFVKDGKTQWRKKSNSGAGSPTVARTHQNNQPQDKPSTTPIEASKSDPASEVGLQVKTIAPRAFGKLWAQGGFVIDDEDKKYTFPRKLVQVAEDAITSGARLKITYRREGNYLNVSKAEPV